MTNVGKKAWLSLAEVVSKFLGNTKDFDYKTIDENMLACFEALGCRMSLKVPFLHAHLHYFPHNLGNMSEEHDECFYPLLPKAWKLGTKVDGMYPYSELLLVPEMQL